MLLKDKVAVITGGGSGIGQKTALLFAAAGAKIAVWDYSEQGAKETVDLILDQGGQAIYSVVDVKDEKAVLNAKDQVMDSFKQVDILINNAGITADGFLSKMNLEQWQNVVDVNLTGVFNCTKAFVDLMMAQGSGCILNTSSVVGVYGNIGQSNYAATKAGLIGLTKTWAKELGRKGIRVNAVAPGFIVTQMTEAVPEKILNLMREKTPLQKLGNPEDIAHAFLFLASPHAGYINGAVLNVDGGLVL